ncbi:MAG: hypothetical protein IT258_22465 [Saprospiraceae bacterium]|nr:hypothetical protein [Saprospiraceae bacterium]
MKTTIPFLFSLLLTQWANAQIVWDGGGGTNNWNDANNWDPNEVPNASSNVIIPLGAIVEVNIESSAVADTLILEGSLTVQNDAVIQIGSYFQCTGSFTSAALVNEFGKMVVQSSATFNSQLLSSDSLICEAGAALNLNNSWNGGGALICKGDVFMDALLGTNHPVYCDLGSTLNIYGTWVNYGSIVNMGTMNIEADFENNGTISNGGNLSFKATTNNYGKISNYFQIVA